MKSPIYSERFYDIKNPVFFLLASLLIVSMVFMGGCKKKEEPNPTKKLSYVTTENEFFMLEFEYNNEFTEKMVYRSNGDSVVFEFVNGLLSSEIHSNGNSIDYIVKANNVQVVRSWDPDNINEVFHLDENNRIAGFAKYTNGELEKESEYIYTNGNITEKRMTFPENKIEALYTYDDHPNPYNNIIIFSDFLTYSANNVLTINDETTATYQYDTDSDVIVAKYSEHLIYIFSYRWE